MGDVLDLLAVALVVAQLLDDEGRGRWPDADFGGSVLALELDHDSNSLPLGALLDDVFADLLGILRSLRLITRPRGPSLGARVAAGPASPPNTLMLTALTLLCTESDFRGIDFGWHSD